MPRITPGTLIAFLSAAAGVVVTLLLASLFASKDPQLQAAEQRFRELPVEQATRLQSTFDTLQELPEQRRHIQAIHKAVTQDPKLDAQLQQLYSWWQSLNDARQAELRGAGPEGWVEETQRQLNRSSAPDTIQLTLRRLDDHQRHGLPIKVTTDQIDQFLKAALPDNLSAKDSQLLDDLKPEDRLLASAIIIVEQTFPSGSDRRDVHEDGVQRIFKSAKENILPEHLQQRKSEIGNLRIAVFGILRSVIRHLSAEFDDRQTYSSQAVEDQFAALNTTEQTAQMMADPGEAQRFLRTLLKSAEVNTPTGRLASRLNRLKRRLRSQFKQASQDQRTDGFRDRRRRDGGPGRDGPPGGRGRGNRGPGPRGGPPPDPPPFAR